MSLLADDFWMAAHDTYKGDAQLSARPLGIGVGAALLAELIAAGNITLSQGRLCVVWESSRPDDPALLPVFNLLVDEEHRRAGVDRELGRSRHTRSVQEPGQELREWIAFLTTDNRAADLVVRRLSQVGLVRAEQRRGWTGKREVHVPVDANTSGWPGVRISTATQRRMFLDEQDLVLAGLFVATELHQKALDQLDATDLRHLKEQFRNRMHPMHRELVSHAGAALGDAVMTR